MQIIATPIPDVLVLEPNSEFFKYLRNPNRGGR